MGDLAVRPSRTASARPGALTAPGLAAVTAAGLSLAAAWIHFSYTASHWRDWWAYGAFFLGMAIFQALSVPAIVRWPRNTWVALTTIAGNLGIVGMYVYSRTVGIPMGPHEGVVEKAGAVDLGCTAGEIVLVGILLTIVGPGSRRTIVNALLVAGVGLWVLRLTNSL
jgi:hypothetical protein